MKYASCQLLLKPLSLFIVQKTRQPVLQIKSPVLNFWSHGRPVSHNFEPWALELVNFLPVGILNQVIFIYIVFVSSFTLVSLPTQFPLLPPISFPLFPSPPLFSMAEIPPPELQITAYKKWASDMLSSVMKLSSKCILLQITFCSCIIATTVRG